MDLLMRLVVLLLELFMQLLAHSLVLLQQMVQLLVVKLKVLLFMPLTYMLVVLADWLKQVVVISCEPQPLAYILKMQPFQIVR
jgi:hypothetical protein